MTLLFSGTIQVAYSQYYLVAATVWPAGAPEPAFAVQSNGLCGASVSGGLVLVAGRASGWIPLDVEFCAGAWPDIDEAWEDVVEVSLGVSRVPALLMEWGLSTTYPLNIRTGSYRVRYSCQGMDLARDHDDARLPGHRVNDRYRLQFRPSDRWRRDEILKVTSAAAVRRHSVVGGG